jgi:serine phosphatase RsbU (regulator of sigma subunit)
MRRRFGGVLILLAACALAAQTTALAQSSSPLPAPSPTPDTRHPTRDTLDPRPETPDPGITLSQSVVPLYGPWKFQTGDSPIDPKTGHPLWAEPAFDDSQWESVDLTPPAGKFDPANPNPVPVPGWRAKGHPDYWGYAWYRLAIPLAANSPNLALAGPASVDSAYQVFLNGDLLGGVGKFDGAGKTPTIYWYQPTMFLLPQSPSSGLPTGHDSHQILTFRVWSPSWLDFPGEGGIHEAPLLGEAGSVAAEVRLEWLARIRACAYSFFEGFLLFLLAIVAASLILFDRSDKVYLVVAAVLFANASLDLFFSLANLTTLLSFTTYVLLLDCVFLPLMMGGWMLVWWIWFRLTRPAWVPRAIVLLTVAYMASQVFGGGFFNGAVPASLVVLSHAASVTVRLLFLPLMVLIVSLGIRKEGREGWLVLPAFVPLAIGQFQNELNALHIPTAWTPFGVVVFLGQIGIDLSAAAISVLLLRRLLLSVRRQRQMALDVKQAQEVQQVILPEARLVLPGLAGLPGLTIESEYRPAREVGGDFFQIIPHKTDGSLLIVAGDVTGKGLKAGMLVALLVGAIRSTLDWSNDPMAVLQALNKRVLGRADAQATCLALRIAADGKITLANAGHMPPYLNGEPIAMEGALPLGMSEAADFSQMHFQLKPNDRLVLLSDGIVEATDENGNLFGFDRVHKLLHSTTTAAEIASAAQSFGQQDDISVISITRTPVAEPAVV